MRASRRIGAALLAGLGLALLGGGTAHAGPLCPLSTTGPWEYQATLGPLVSDPGPTLPTPPSPPGAPARPPAPPPRSGPGAFTVAQHALGAQYAGAWLHSGVQGWVIGVAPGPLDLDGARAAIVAALVPHFSASEHAYLASRLHVDPQPYAEADVRATGDAVLAALRGASIGPVYSVGAGGCQLSDGRRVEVTLYATATPADVLRVNELVAPFGDRVRVALVPYGPPMAMPMPGIAPPPSQHQQQQPIALGTYATMPLARRCVRGAQVSVRVRAGRSSVRALTVVAGGRTRTIVGKRLRKPLVVALRGPRTRVAATVRLADGRVATRTVTYERCR